MDPNVAMLIVIVVLAISLIPGFIASHYGHRYEVAVWVATIAVLAHALFYLVMFTTADNAIQRLRPLDALWFSVVAWVGTLVWSCMAIETERQPKKVSSRKTSKHDGIEENNARWAANHGLGHEPR